MKRILFLLPFIIICMINTIYAQNPDYLFMVEQAIKAPSGHNTQPWLFKINENSIEIHPDLNKALPVVDADNRELFISLGCATENLCIAASQKGYSSAISVSDKGIITIELTKQGDIMPNSLFGQIDTRQSNRRVYNKQIIPFDSLDVLKAIPLEQNVNMHLYANGTPSFDTIKSYILKGNTLQMHDTAFTNELYQWMRFNKKHQNATNNGLSYAVFGAPNLPKFIVKPIMKKALNPKRQNKGDEKKIQSASHFVLFTTKHNTVSDWVNLGISLERFLLKSTEMGIAHSYLNPPNEIKELSVEMIKALNISAEYPAIILRVGYAKPMPYSKRRDVKEVIIQ